MEAIVGTSAAENGLKPAVTAAAASIVTGHIDQIDESDIAVLTRVAAQYDLIAKPTGGSLFVGRRGASVNASGQPMGITVLRESDVTFWTMRRVFGEAVGSVVATWRDLDAAKDVEVKMGEGAPVRRIRQRFTTEAEATATAEAELRRSGRMKETLEITMPGNPKIAAEGTIVPIAFSSAAAGPWVVTTATHSVSEAGFSTSITAERPE